MFCENFKDWNCNVAVRAVKYVQRIKQIDYSSLKTFVNLAGKLFNCLQSLIQSVRWALSAALSSPGSGCANFHQWGASLGLQSQSEARRGSSLPGLERVQCPAKLKRIVRAVGSLLELREGRGSQTWRHRTQERHGERVWTFSRCKDKPL